MHTGHWRSSERLAQRALRELDVHAMEARGIATVRLTRWANGAAMTRDEQGALVMAVISLAAVDSSIVHVAERLRGQLRAALEFDIGVTATHAEPRPDLYR